MSFAIEHHAAASVSESGFVGPTNDCGVANPHPIGDSIAMMLVIMDLLSRQTVAKLDDMQRKSNVSRDAQDMANRVESTLATLIKPQEKAAVPADVIHYMKQNNILVNDMGIDEFIANKTIAGQDSRQYSLMREKMQAMIARSGPDGMTSTPWQDVVSYLDDHGIKIDNKRVCDYIWALPEVSYRSGQKISLDHMKAIGDVLQSLVGLDKADLMSVKSSLESVSGRASDFVQQSQLKMQQLMQNYNTAVQMINSLQGTLAESTKSIASAIR
ncbi:secretion protein EspA [Burkholderia sp. Bp9126]|nr:secretion protein EspA [Burkholderia sp. Bp9126]